MPSNRTWRIQLLPWPPSRPGRCRCCRVEWGSRRRRRRPCLAAASRLAVGVVGADQEVRMEGVDGLVVVLERLQGLLGRGEAIYLGIGDLLGGRPLRIRIGVVGDEGSVETDAGAVAVTGVLCTASRRATPHRRVMDQPAGSGPDDRGDQDEVHERCQAVGEQRLKSGPGDVEYYLPRAAALADDAEDRECHQRVGGVPLGAAGQAPADARGQQSRPEQQTAHQTAGSGSSGTSVSSEGLPSVPSWSSIGRGPSP